MKYRRRENGQYLQPAIIIEAKMKKEGKIVLGGSIMQYEKRTITSFMKYRRRENWQYLHTAIIIDEKGKQKEKSC